MAKSTNHTAHNQSYKNHRNGIKKPDKLGRKQRRAQRGVRAHLPAHSPGVGAGEVAPAPKGESTFAALGGRGWAGT